jgi:hypothetical protein
MLYYFSCNHLYLYKYDSLRGYYAYSLYMHNIHVNLYFSSSSSSMLSHRCHSRKPGRWLPASAPSKFVTSAAQALTTVVPVDPHPIELFQRRQSKRNNTVCIHHRHRSLAFQYSTPRPPIEYKMDCTAPASADRTSPTTKCQSPQLTHRSEVHGGATAANTPRRSFYALIFCRNPVLVSSPKGSATSLCSSGKKSWWSTPVKANGELAPRDSFLVHDEGNALDPYDNGPGYDLLQKNHCFWKESNSSYIVL